MCQAGLMRSLRCVILCFFLCLLLIEAKQPLISNAQLPLVQRSQELSSKLFGIISRTDLRREGRAITRRRLAWMKVDDLMKMPIMKLHSIPPHSWSGLSPRQASKLTSSFVARLTEEQARMISPKAVKSMPESARRVYVRLTNRPPVIFRLASMAVAGAVAFLLYRYTTVPMKQE